MLAFALGLAVGGGAASAQGTDGAAPLGLESRPDGDRVGGVEEGTGPEGLTFRVDELSVLQPVTVALVAVEPGTTLHLTLHKNRWDEVARKGVARAEQPLVFRIRTGGRLAMRVRSSGERARFRLLVRVGAEEEMPLPDAIAPGGRGARGAAATGLGVLALGGLLLPARGRRRSRIVALAAALGLAGTAAPAIPLTGDEIETILGAIDDLAAVEEGGPGVWELLTGADQELEPQYEPPGAPYVPAQCAGSNACRRCLNQALDDLDEARRNLETLRAVYATSRRIRDDAVAVGDSIASLPHAGLGWATQKRRIEAAFAEVGRAYDEKYSDLIGRLREALETVAGCELEFFEDPDWFERYGRLYYDFMADRYRR